MSHDSNGATRVRGLMVSTDLDLAIQRLIAELRHESETAVDFSTITRVLWTIAIDCPQGLAVATKGHPIGARPKNGDPARKLEYEERWVDVFRSGLRDALRSAETAMGDIAFE